MKLYERSCCCRSITRAFIRPYGPLTSALLIRIHVIAKRSKTAERAGGIKMNLDVQQCRSEKKLLQVATRTVIRNWAS